ncbi:MAG TPA: hypothetical protein VNT79_14365 [Phycisphaerae bacterium]|nr:hypothetical protein [Phycisphaerae bacterium]
MSKSREILILESGADQLRLSLARLENGRVVILDSHSVVSQEKREDRTAVQDQILVDDLSVAISEREWVGKDLFCLVSGGTSSCQYFDMPTLAGPALRQAVLLKLGQQLHFPVDQAIVDIHPVKSATAEKHNQTRVAATVIQRDAAQAVVDAAARWGVRLAGTSSSASALTSLAIATAAKSDAMQAVLHFGERASTLAAVRGETPAVTSELPIGLEDFTKALMRPIISGDDVIQLDPQKAAELRDSVGIPEADQQIESLGIVGAKLYPLIEPTMQKLTQQLTQWMTFASTTEGGEKVKDLKVTGLGAAMHGLSAALATRLKISVEPRSWLDNLTATEGAADRLKVDGFAAATAAVLYQAKLPDLIPPDVRTAWKVRRIRRSTALICPIVATVIIGFTFLFNQVRQFTQTSYGSQTALTEMQSLVETNSKFEAECQRVAQLQATLDGFAKATPAWEGLFKEFSKLFPSEFRATKYTGVTQPDGLHVRVDASIYTTPGGRDFDEVIEQTLMAMERSPFFEKVQLVNSLRHPNDGTHVETGTMAIDLKLAYVRPKPPAEAAP